MVTANGDGVSVDLRLDFSVLRVDCRRDVRTEVFDLSGHRLWTDGQQRIRASGAYRVLWPGVSVNADCDPLRRRFVLEGTFCQSQFLSLRPLGLQVCPDMPTRRYQVAASAKVKRMILRVMQIDRMPPAHAGIRIAQ